MSTLLVIDDDLAVLQVFSRVFRDSDIVVLGAATAKEGLAQLEAGDPDVVVLDVMLPDASGLETFRRIAGRDAHLPILVISAREDSDTAIGAMNLGAFDYLCKPLDFRLVRELVDKALEVRRLMHVPVLLSDTAQELPARSDVLIGHCPAMQELYKSIGRVASQNTMVLVRGESGTGKELIARAIYQHSARKQGKFLAVNCAAIPEPLLESELFGHEKGAFTLCSASGGVNFRWISPAARRQHNSALAMIVATSSGMASVRFARRAVGSEVTEIPFDVKVVPRDLRQSRSS